MNESTKNILESAENLAKEWGIPLGMGAAFAAVVRKVAFGRVDVDGVSMDSTLQNKDILFEEKLSRHIRGIKRGDIVTFKSHDPECPFYIKRVIGIGGDTIEIHEGSLYVNGEELLEAYLDEDSETEAGSFLVEDEAYTVPDNMYFVLGDNREVSNDSRYFGPVKAADIQGRVFARVFPFHSFKRF